MDHDEVAAQAEAEAKTLERQGDRLADEIESVRRAGESNKADPSVPGARPDEPGDGEPAEDEDRAGH